MPCCVARDSIPSRDLLPVATALHYAMGGVAPTSKVTRRAPGSGPPARWPAPACTAPTGSRRTRCSRDWSSRTGWRARWRASREARASRRAIATADADADTGADAAFDERAAGDARDHDARRRRGRAPRRAWPTRRRGWRGWSRRRRATAWRTHRQLSVAQLITRSARGRRESQGSHRRADFPPRPARQPL